MIRKLSVLFCNFALFVFAYVFRWLRVKQAFINIHTMIFKGAHILSVEQFERSDIDFIFKTADLMLPYARKAKITKVLDGAVLGNLFFEPSTRTRVSFGAAFNRLGGRVRDTTGMKFSSIVKGESNHDTSRVISGYCDVMVVRHPEVGTLKQFANASDVPVINGGDGIGEHPSQSLLDTYTIVKEVGRLDDLKIAMVGDLKYGRTVHSLAKLLSLYKNIEFSFVAPKDIQLPEDIIDFIHRKENNHKIHVTENLEEGTKDMDIIYSTRMQEERFHSPEAFQKYRGKYRIDQAFAHGYCPNAKLFHPLPRDSRNGADELSHDLNDHPNLAIFRQTDNGIPIRMALFALTLDVVEQIEKTARPVNWYVPRH